MIAEKLARFLCDARPDPDEGMDAKICMTASAGRGELNMEVPTDGDLMAASEKIIKMAMAFSVTVSVPVFVLVRVGEERLSFVSFPRDALLDPLMWMA